MYLEEWDVGMSSIILKTGNVSDIGNYVDAAK